VGLENIENDRKPSMKGGYKKIHKIWK